MRETLEEALIADEMLYSRWKPWADVTVETWLIPANPWHLRVHRISTPRRIESMEGGFAIARADFNKDRAEVTQDRAIWFGQSDASAIMDLSDQPIRKGHAQLAIANTNLVHAKTLVPQLRGTIPAGQTVLSAAICALPVEAGADFLNAVPTAPDLAALESLFRQSGRRVAAFDLR
jgi:hypothetical protein